VSHHSRSHMQRIDRCVTCGNTLSSNQPGRVPRCEDCSKMFRLALFGRFEYEPIRIEQK
jgi:hypothetical protein